MKWIDFDDRIRTLSETRYKISWNAESLSIFQFSVKQFFKEYWFEDTVGEEVKIPDTRLRIDLLNFSKRIAVEVNGLHHILHQPHWQKKESDFEDQIFRDVLKEHLLEKNGFRVIEIYEKNMPLTPRWISQTFGEGILD